MRREQRKALLVHVSLHGGQRVLQHVEATYALDLVHEDLGVGAQQRVVGRDLSDTDVDAQWLFCSEREHAQLLARVSVAQLELVGDDSRRAVYLSAMMMSLSSADSPVMP